jgi:hypothetical protein
MKYAKELLELVEQKEYKTFWHCVASLVRAGYSELDSFGVALHKFGENNIFKDVAFIRNEMSSEVYNQNDIIMTQGIHDALRLQLNMDRGHEMSTRQLLTSLNVWIIDDTNIHLSGLYKIYREAWYNEKITEPDSSIEGTCEKITINKLSPFMLWFLDSKAFEHFGLKQMLVVNSSKTKLQKYL